jgi:2-polyprenyl-6-methoxyphenol hydroxylase-like FAD-dependent oxidoreductase
VQARTLELYRQIGLADAVVARGRPMRAINLWAAGKPVAHAVLGDMGSTISPFPYALIFPQDEHERLLADGLAQAGIHVERETELVAFAEKPERVLIRLKRADGGTEACAAAYVAGCDGAHSTVREAMEVGFPGGTYDHLFYVADVEARGPAMNGELHAALDTSDFLAVFPLKEDGRAGSSARCARTSKRQHETLSWKA